MSKARDIANAGTALATVDATELGYLDGVTSAIQTQVDAKIAKTLTTTTGDIIYASGANTPARLAVGSTDDVLTVAGGVPTWAAPAGAVSSFTLLNPGGTSLSAASVVTLSGISGMNELMVIFNSSTTPTGPNQTIGFQLNSDTATNYQSYGAYIYAGVSWTPGNVSMVNSLTTQAVISYSGGDSSSYQAGYINIKNCLSSAPKLWISATGADRGGINDGQRNMTLGGYYSGTSAITSISFKTSGSSFDGGAFFVYGSAV
jgi:hypothetical protein